MRWVTPGITVFLCASLIGCGRGTPGGPGTQKEKQTKTNTQTGQTETTETTKTTESAKTFTLDVPNLATKIKQGEKQQVTIGVNRGREFDQDVTLKFDIPGDAKGLKIDPGEAAVKKSEKEAKVSVSAADDAATGTYDITVHGKPQTGNEAKNHFKVTVNAK